MQKVLLFVILAASVILVGQIAYYFVGEPDLETENIVTPAASNGEFAFLGEVVPEGVVPMRAGVLVVLPVPCEGCDENVPTWNRLTETGIEVRAVSRGIEMDIDLFKKRTGANFAIDIHNDRSFWDRYGDPNNFPITFVIDERRAIVWAKIGRVWNVERIAAHIQNGNPASRGR